MYIGPYTTVRQLVPEYEARANALDTVNRCQEPEVRRPSLRVVVGL